MKKVLITGASSGIGAALCTHYAQHHQVIACSRRNVVNASGNITPLQFDVTDEQQVKAAAEQINDIDIVILNAGSCEYIDDATHFDSALFERVIATNLLSVGYCLGAFLPKMVKGAQLVIVSSSAAILPLPRAEAYGSSKAALSYLTKTLALTLPDIEVSLVSPGFVDTPLTAKNHFEMPFLMSADAAAQRIATGISKRKRHIAFPKRLIFSMYLLKLLPFSLWRRWAQGMSK
ncbi:SDR family NAD(P)-dependent oxidoreductase [Pseudoalteromonas fenneropenaei]|uniref:SDR family NAD(P)-dependent oxidoreductase n=1 Tax=Pseudoalteromonas fenneropenaei TaxID=1737459 RepID=A0ABV7CMQ5_9GAMM